MSWEKIGGKLIQGGASLLGNALLPGVGGAVGTKAGSMVAEALGLESSAGPDEVDAALANDPQALAKVREAERDRAHELAMAGIEERKHAQAQVTERHKNDMQSDSWLSKNIRPLTLAFLLLYTAVLVLLDAAMGDEFKVAPHWVQMYSTLLLYAVGFYFIGREVGKMARDRANGGGGGIIGKAIGGLMGGSKN